MDDCSLGWILGSNWNGQTSSSSHCRWSCLHTYRIVHDEVWRKEGEINKQNIGETLTVKERDPYLCAAGSFFFPGLGQVYCGRILRGIVFLVPAVLLTIPYSILSLSVYFDHVGTWWTYWSSFVTLISKIVDFVVRVIATYDAYKLAKLTKTV